MITPAADSATVGDSHVGWTDRLLLALLLLAVFARGLFTPLQTGWDDARFIINNPLVQSVSWSNFVANISRIQFEAYHPLHLLSYWLDVPWFGVDALPIHATSLLLWIVASWCVLQAFRELGLSRIAALIATAVCMVHPINVEAVTWASGRKDILALLFSALAITWHLRSATFADRAAWISRLMFVCAALSKTSVATLPLLLLLIDLALARRSLRKALVQQLPAILVMLALGVLTVLTWQASQMLRVRGDNEPSLLWRVSATTTHQLLTAMWPSRNAPMYATHHWADPNLLHLIGPALVVIASIVLWRSRQRLAAVGLMGFFILLLPASNTLAMVFPLQDRYLVLPLLSLALCLGALLNSALLNSALSNGATARAVHVLGASCVIALGCRTVQYEGAWQSELTLWQHAAATQPNAYYAWMKVGEVRRDEGNLDGSVAAYRTMVSLVPDVERGHVALFHALVLLDEKRSQLPASLPMELARRFSLGMRDPAEMHQLSQQMIARGYNQAAAMALDYALTLKPFPLSVVSQNAERFERAHRPHIAAVLRRHEKQSAQ